MPSNVKTWVENKTVSGEKLQWVSAGLGGLMCISNWPDSDKWRMYRDFGDIYCSTDEYLQADVLSRQAEVEHATFSSGGGWFVRYRNGNVRLSMKGTFPDVFHEIAKEHMTTEGSSSFVLQRSSISNVFFGTNDAIIIQQNVPSVPSYLRNNSLLFKGLPEEVNQSLRDMCSQGWILTRNTCLSPHNSEHYYIEWSGQYGDEIRSMYSLPAHHMLPPLFIRQIWEGEVPTSIPKELPAQSFIPTHLKRTKSIPLEVTKPTSNGTEIWSSDTSEEMFNMCEDIFKQWSDFENTMSGQRFKALCKSILPAADMAKIWTMADADKNGVFSHDEFIIAFCLVLAKKSGNTLPATTTPLELLLMDRKKTSSHRARLTKLLNPTVDLSCTSCNEEVRTGSWMCNGCDTCLQFGVKPPGIGFMLCVSCAFDNADKIKAQKHNEVWTKHVIAESGVPGGILCSLCGACWKGPRRPHVCVDCDFDACEFCYEVGLLCPAGHELTLVDDDLTFGLGSMSLKETNSSKLSSTTDNDEDSTNPFTSNSQSKATNEKPKDDSLTDDQKALRSSLQSSILKESPNVQWDDVAGLDQAKEELQEAVILPIRFPKLFSGKRKARTGILLYGPPGTGKSYLAKAVATEASATLFSISSSSVMSKWLGESERLIKTLFEMAREEKPSVVFIDEIDALCGSRDAPGANPHMAGLKTEIMVQMDGVGFDNQGVLVLAATNLPWSLDSAIRRRLQRKIYIPLPDEPARCRMFEVHVGKTPCGLKPEHYIELGKRTNGLSGSDIGNAVQDALMQPVKKVSSSKHWRKVIHNGDEKLSPCNATDPGAIPMNWRQVPASKLLESEVEVEDFFQVLQKVKSTVSADEIKKYLDWTEQFGMEG